MNEDMLNQKPEGSRGSLIGSIIVVLILIVGAIYLYASRGPATPAQPGGETPGGTVTTEPVAVEPADDVASLQADAQAIDLSGLDADVAALEQTVTTP
jgi:hypothetical protein